jgi:hypothetical protein
MSIGQPASESRGSRRPITLRVFLFNSSGLTNETIQTRSAVGTFASKPEGTTVAFNEI